MKKNVLVMLGLFLVFCFVGCKSKKDAMSNEMKMDPNMKMDHPAAQGAMKTAGDVIIRNAKKEEIGMDTVCPVMKDKFKVTAETKAAEYKGKTYYFCCDDCPPLFQEDPGKYLK